MRSRWTSQVSAVRTVRCDMAASSSTKRAKRVSREPLSLFPDTPRWCTRCERFLPPGAFNRDKKQRDGLFPHCRECRAAFKRTVYPRDAQAFAIRHLRRTYGIDPETFAKMLEAQGGLCATCSKPMKKGLGPLGPQVDHCHITGHVRGILCNGCNRALGYARDDPTVLRAMADYIERHRLSSDAT